MKPLPVGITMGDPAGIGPEIVAKLFAEGLPAPCIVIGDAAIMQRAMAVIGADLPIRAITGVAEAACLPNVMDVLAAGTPPGAVPYGVVDAHAGAAAHAAIQRAIDGALDGSLRAIVTAPIHKGSLRAAGICHPGHTEILAERAGTADVAMMLANDELRVVLVTIHVALRDVIAGITPAAELRAIRLAETAARRFGIAQPRVAVAGLNPHAGEGGLFGSEETAVIAPAIAQVRAEGIDATGPWPGDTVFMRARRGEFDVVVAQYHDQGLIPVKYLGLDHGVNITLGLPFVRTSVDHGTAFDIAGTGKADPASLRYAVRQALAMTAYPASGEGVSA
ncbi:4-hydroxythreonine-4-phosphate dehydrogenase PdxA [Acidisoma sp. S159]|uniref:4-hydroxythreonine-4-phosphate dehydrogenase PdxA n=1 Tax=Acidisoma sp. S159 TaxID=1747225 RepID=UPI00131DBA32|nr:4-hydroxythreonine-4-phosphate dehydrogenase PdxA [Acidisoma sp. S159]